MHGLITLVPRLLENVSLEIECVYVSRLVCMLFFRRCMYVFACLPGFFARFQMLRVDHMCIFWRSRHTYEFDMFLATSAWPWRFTTCGSHIFEVSCEEKIIEVGVVCAMKWFLENYLHLPCELDLSASLTVFSDGFLGKRKEKQLQD